MILNKVDILLEHYRSSTDVVDGGFPRMEEDVLSFISS